MSVKLSLKDIEDAIEQFDQQEKQLLLSKLFSLLKISKEDIALLKVAESSFDFRDNPEDSIYDNL
jgi:hypothetical protein